MFVPYSLFKPRLHDKFSVEAEMHVEIAGHFKDVPIAFLCRYPQALKLAINFIFSILTLSTAL